MKLIRLLILCAAALIFAPASWGAPTSDPAQWQFAQAGPPTPPSPTLPSIPQRRIAPNRRTNALPAAVTAPPSPVVPPTPNAAGNTAGAPIPGSAATPTSHVASGSLTNADGTVVEAATEIYDIPAMPIDQFLDSIYAPLVGRTLIRSGVGPGAIPGTATITLKTQKPLTRSEAKILLETALEMNGITIINVGDKFAKVVAEASAPQQGDVLSTNNAYTNLPLAGKFVTQVIQLKYANGQDLTDLLKQFSKGQSSIIYVPSTQTLILRDYSENVARMLELVAKIDVTSPLQVKPEVIAVRYALASDLMSALTALGASGTSVGSSGKSGANFSARGGSGGSSGFGNSGSSGFGNSSSGGFGNSSGSYPGQSVGTYSEDMHPVNGFNSDTFTPMAANPGATAARSSFQNNLQKIVNNAASGGQFTLFGQTKIIADERTNSLLVFANDEDMKMIKDIISRLDVVLPQVLIEAIIMEINLQGTRNTGVSYLSQNQSVGKFSGAGGLNNLSSGATSFLGGGTNSTSAAQSSAANLANLPSGFSYFAKYGNDLNVVLEAVAGDSRINVLSRPRIQTSHAVPADLFIGNTVPYVTGTYNYGYGSGPSSQYTEKEVGIRLQVLPLINPDGLVEMDIQQDIEQLGPDVQIAGVGGVPTTTKRQAGAKVAVLDGQSILLGGFISDSRSKSDSGIPFLKDIPVFGHLFKSTSIDNLRTELVIMMRPTVLPTPTIAAKVAAVERDKLSGIKQAELEIREDERKRNADIDKQLQKAEEKRRQDAIKRGDYNSYVPGVTNLNAVPPIEQ